MSSRPNGLDRIKQAERRFNAFRQRSPFGTRFVTKSQARSDRRVIVRAFSQAKLSRSRVMSALGIEWYGTLLSLLGWYGFPLYHLPPSVIRQQVREAIEVLNLTEKD